MGKKNQPSWYLTSFVSQTSAPSLYIAISFWFPFPGAKRIFLTQPRWVGIPLAEYEQGKDGKTAYIWDGQFIFSRNWDCCGGCHLFPSLPHQRWRPERDNQNDGYGPQAIKCPGFYNPNHLDGHNWLKILPLTLFVRAGWECCKWWWCDPRTLQLS